MKILQTSLLITLILKPYLTVTTLGWEYETKPIWTDLDQSDTGIQILGNEIVQLRTYKRISSDFDKYKEIHKSCFQEIEDKDFSEKKIKTCVGRNFNFVQNDINFELKKLLARVEKRIKGIFLEKCYKIETGDLKQITYCDLLESDTLEVMWSELNFYDLMDHHKSKYLYTHAEIPEVVYEQIRLEIKTVYNNLSEILDEVLDHRRILIFKLKRYINNRTRSILREKGDLIEEKVGTHYKSFVKIDESVVDPNSVYLGNLPNQVLMDTSEHVFSKKNGYKEDFLKEFPDYVVDQTNSFKGEGPIVNIPEERY